VKAKLVATVAALGLLAVPASSLGGDQPTSAPSAKHRGYGQLVAKDSAKQHPEAAATRARLSEFGKVSYVISTKPAHLPVEWAVMARCSKGFLFDYYPGPGDLHTTTKKATISGSFTIPLADPDSCDFSVAGQIGGETEKRGKVFVKIYDQG
jgi:hypothetical protein